MVEHPLWKAFFMRIRPSYELPSRKQLSTVLLDSQYDETKRAVDEELNSSSVLHMQCDGWSNIRNESILNFIVTQPKPFFVDFVATEAKRHTAEYLAEQMDKVMQKYGPEKFYSAIGDGAANEQAALRILKSKYPHINISACVAHTLHLLCKDLTNLPSAKKTFANAKLIINKIRKSHRLNSIFMTKQKEKNIKTALKIPPEPRWGYAQQTLESLIENKNVLMMMAVDTEFDGTDGDENIADFSDEEDTYDDSDPVDLPGEVKKLVLDERFWRKIESLNEILKPIFVGLTKIETDNLIIHESNAILTSLFNTIEALITSAPVYDSRDKKAAAKIIKDRKSSIIKPVMFAAAILNPRDMGSSLTNEQQMDGMEFIYNSAKALGEDQSIVITQQSEKGFVAKRICMVCFYSH